MRSLTQAVCCASLYVAACTLDMGGTADALATNVDDIGARDDDAGPRGARDGSVGDEPPPALADAGSGEPHGDAGQPPPPPPAHDAGAPGDDGHDDPPEPPVEPRAPGAACRCDDECAGDALHRGLCLGGVCMVEAAAPCSAAGSQFECPYGTGCWPASMFDGYVCFPDCLVYPCEGVCDLDNACVPGLGTSCDATCGSGCTP